MAIILAVISAQTYPLIKKDPRCLRHGSFSALPKPYSLVVMREAYTQCDLFTKIYHFFHKWSSKASDI